MIRSLYHPSEGNTRTDLPLDELPAALGDPGGLLWLDLVEEPPEVCRPILRDTFGFHPLAVQDALEQAHVPKVDDWSDYLYLVLHAIAWQERNRDRVDTLEVDIFLGPNYVVTHCIQPIPAVERLWASCQRDERHLHKGATRLLYLLADELVADYMPVFEQFDLAIDRIEDRIFRTPTSPVLQRVFALKRALVHLRRIIAPQREVLNKLARGDFGVIADEERAFFRDVYDHLVRLYDINESLRDLVSGALDTYLSVVNNRMNEVMKSLTLITVLFMPLSFIAGFFGMNFFLPAAAQEVGITRLAFLVMLAAMVLTPLGMYLWIRKRAWM